MYLMAHVQSFSCLPYSWYKGCFSVWHEWLIYKLKSVGVSNLLLKLIQSFSTNGLQRVLLNSQTSEWLPVNVMCHKGLFLVYSFFFFSIKTIYKKRHIKRKNNNNKAWYFFFYQEETNNQQKNYSQQFNRHISKSLTQWSDFGMVTCKSKCTKRVSIIGLHFVFFFLYKQYIQKADT